PSSLHAPPIPTLFPYTTLFRSRGDVRRPRGDGPGHGRPPSVGTGALHRRGGHHERGLREGGPGHRRVQGTHRRADGEAGHLPEADRKSTRLNSSHVSISYAVFC